MSRGAMPVRRSLAPALIYALLLLGIAMIGGGWLALGRVDPVLAVPGAGWAAVAALWAKRADDRPGPSLGLAVLFGSMLLALCQSLDGLSGFRAIEWALAASGLAVAAMAAALFVSAGLAIAGTSRWKLGVVRLIAMPLFAIGWTALAWPVVAAAYHVEVPADTRPRLAWSTSLPLAEQRYFDVQWGVPTTGAQERPVPHLINAATRATRLVRIDAATLAESDVLLLVHPPALDPAQLVAIDDWVRAGGRAVILADGLSSWPPQWPLGDPRNPPVTSLLGPLLAHWGLELDAPARLAESRISIADSGERLELLSAGRFRRVKPGCVLRAAGMIGDCRVGQGRVTLLADADLLDPVLWAGAGAGINSIDSRTGNALWILDKIYEYGDAPDRLSWVRPSWSRSRQAYGHPDYGSSDMRTNHD